MKKMNKVIFFLDIFTFFTEQRVNFYQTMRIEKIKVIKTIFFFVFLNEVQVNLSQFNKIDFWKWNCLQTMISWRKRINNSLTYNRRTNCDLRSQNVSNWFWQNSLCLNWVKRQALFRTTSLLERWFASWR